MATQIFVNLPVKDLPRAVAFFTKLGYTFNPGFTDENATCMIVAEGIYVMLLVEPFFKGFTSKTLADTRTTIEVLLGLSHDSRESVNRVVDAALAAGGKQHKDPMDHGFMFQRSFEDLDGHVWEHIWMDPAHVPH